MKDVSKMRHFLYRAEKHRAKMDACLCQAAAFAPPSLRVFALGAKKKSENLASAINYLSHEEER